MHKQQRTAHRWRLLIGITAGIFLAAGSFWLVHLMQRSDQDLSAAANQSEPDYIVEKFSFVRMTPEGRPRYLFYGAKLSHRPLDDSSEVVQPIMQSMTPGEPSMTINAQRARIAHAENVVTLLGKVDINRPASPTAQALRLKTEALTVFPDEERMQSDVPVQMVMGAATVTGAGMRANNASRQLDMVGRGKIIYPPKAVR
ncbi:MAG: LPS export ABC transporter periplasmic protein LptC [Pseudomonadota bacterium]